MCHFAQKNPEGRATDHRTSWPPGATLVRITVTLLVLRSGASAAEVPCHDVEGWNLLLTEQVLCRGLRARVVRGVPSGIGSDESHRSCQDARVLRAIADVDPNPILEGQGADQNGSADDGRVAHSGDPKGVGASLTPHTVEVALSERVNLRGADAGRAGGAGGRGARRCLLHDGRDGLDDGTGHSVVRRGLVIGVTASSREDREGEHDCG